MEKLNDILWPVILIGGLGGLIDFLIGKAGQEKAKYFIIKWWVRFDDVQWNDFGREEGLFAGQLIGRWCGPKTWNLRRFILAIILILLYLSVGYLLTPSWKLINLKFYDMCHYCDREIYFTILIISIYFLGFTMSISFTKFITIRMAYLCGSNRVRNLLIFIVMLIV